MLYGIQFDTRLSNDPDILPTRGFGWNQYQKFDLKNYDFRFTNFF